MSGPDPEGTVCEKAAEPAAQTVGDPDDRKLSDEETVIHRIKRGLEVYENSIGQRC